MGGDLTEAQRSALEELAPLLRDDFYLGGGVAIALRIHHRCSHDLDLFATKTDPTDLEERLAQFPGIQIVDRAPGTLHLRVGETPVSLLRYRYPCLHEPERVMRVPVAVGSMDDLLCMKLSAIGGRGARRDFWDLHALLRARGLSLSQAFELFARKYSNVDPGHIVRALSYFADADAEPMLDGLPEDAWERIKQELTRDVLALE